MYLLRLLGYGILVQIWYESMPLLASGHLPHRWVWLYCGRFYFLGFLLILEAHLVYEYRLSCLWCGKRLQNALTSGTSHMFFLLPGIRLCNGLCHKSSCCCSTLSQPSLHGNLVFFPRESVVHFVCFVLSPPASM